MGEETKALLEAAREGAAPRDPPLQKAPNRSCSSDRCPGAGTPQADTAAQEQLVCYVPALDGTTVWLLTHIFSWQWMPSPFKK